MSGEQSSLRSYSLPELMNACVLYRLRCFCVALYHYSLYCIALHYVHCNFITLFSIQIFLIINNI